MSVDKLLAAAFPGSRSGPAAGPPRMRLVDLDANAWRGFLLGADPEPWDRSAAKLWQRLVTETGTACWLADVHDLDWDALAHDKSIALAVAGPRGVVDVAAAVCRTVRRDWERDRAYARAFRPLPRDLTGLVPADVGALRHGLLSAAAFTDSDYTDPSSRLERLTAASAGTAAYLAAAHLAPADLALDMVTTAPLEPELSERLRLPARWSLMVHEPVTLAAAQADDDELATLIDAGACAGDEPAIIGGLLAAHDDFTLDTRSGWLLVTAIAPDGTRAWSLQPARHGGHGAGRVLLSYAAQLAFADWDDPPEAEDAWTTGSNRAAQRAAATRAGRDGAFHRVRVRAYTPPPAEVTPAPEPAGRGTELTEGTFRRAHWKPGVRIGIRDTDGRLVGPVYKTGVEGQTFTRQPRFIPRSRIRPDLPPTTEPAVYTLLGPTRST